MSTDPTRIGRGLAAGSSGAQYGFMDSYMKITPRQWKAGTEYNEAFNDAEFDKAGNMFQKMQEIMNLFGVFGEFIKPFLTLLEVFDAALIGEYAEEIQDLNEAVAQLYPLMEDLAEAIHDISTTPTPGSGAWWVQGMGTGSYGGSGGFTWPSPSFSNPLPGFGSGSGGGNGGSLGGIIENMFPSNR
jgi:hypothetical protein